MNRKKIISLVTAILTTAVIFSGCGQASKTSDNGATAKKQDFQTHITDVIKATDPSKNPDVAKNRKDTIVVGIDAPEGVFDPLYAESAYDMYIDETIFDGLFDIDGEGNPIPGISSKWDISSDGLTYTFHMKDNVKFSDGTPVTADDVAFTYTLICDPKYSGVVDAPSLGLKGFKEYNEGTADSVEGIKVVDPHTIQFTLDKPNASAIYSLGSGILSKAYYGKDYKKGEVKGVEALHLKPMGCGQYKFADYTAGYKAGQEVDLVANENYWKGVAKTKNLIYKVTTEETRIQQLKTGETDIDMVTVKPENVDDLKGTGFMQLQIFPTNGYGYIGLNFKNPILSDQKVRQAIAYGLNRAQVVKTVYKGYAEVCNEPTSKVSWTYSDDVNKYEYNQDTANKLLDEAGWKKGADGIREKDGKKLELRFAASTPNPVNDVLIPIAQQDFKNLGIKFTPESMEFNAVRQKIKSGDFDMYFMAWGLTADPDETTIFKTGASQNQTNYSNSKIDDLLAKGLLETNKDNRKKIYQDFYKEINNDLPYIFMYQRKDMWAINSRINGINTTPYRDFTYDLWKAEIK